MKTLAVKRIDLFLTIVLGVTLTLFGLFEAQAACNVSMDFEPPLIAGTQYGAPVGHNPGDVVFTSNRVPVSVQKFIFTSGGGTFNVAYIDSAPYPFGSGQSIRTNNINMEFDFRQLGFKISKMSLEFLDLGGFENISVNGSPVFAGELSSAPTTVGNVTITTSSTDILNNQGVRVGKKGKITLKGKWTLFGRKKIKLFRIGGQEFWIDNICGVR